MHHHTEEQFVGLNVHLEFRVFLLADGGELVDLLLEFEDLRLHFLDLVDLLLVDVFPFAACI